MQSPAKRATEEVLGASRQASVGGPPPQRGRAQPWGVSRPGPIPRHPSIESTDAERCRASSAAAEALGVAGLGAGAAGPPASTEASARRSASGGRAAGRGAGRRCSAAGGGVVRTQTVAVAVRHLLLVGESVECVKGPHGCVGGGKRKSNPRNHRTGQQSKPCQSHARAWVEAQWSRRCPVWAHRCRQGRPIVTCGPLSMRAEGGRCRHVGQVGAARTGAPSGETLQKKSRTLS